MAAQTNTNPASAGNIDPAQQIKAKITMPNDPPMGIPGQWGYQPLQNPVPGMGTSQYQSALNPRIAPNLSEYPLGVDPMMWNTYLGNNPYSDYSWNNQMAGIVQPADVNSWIMQYLTPQQQSQVTPGQIAALQNGGSNTQPTFNMLGGLGGLGGYTPGPWPPSQQTPGMGQSVVSAGVNMGSANPVNVAGMSGYQPGGQQGYGQPQSVYQTSPVTAVNYAQQLQNQPTPQPIGTYPLSPSAGSGGSDLASQIARMYQSIMGRAPTQDTLDYFTNDIGSGKATVNDLQNTLSAFTKNNATDQNPSGRLGSQVFSDPQTAIWMNAMDQGRQAVAGINRMPFTFSNYAGVPSDPSAAYDLFYPKTTLTDYESQLLGMGGNGASGGASSQYYFPKAVQDYKSFLESASNPPQDIDAALKAYDNALFTKVSNGPGYDASGMPWGNANNTDNQTMQNAWGAYSPMSYS